MIGVKIESYKRGALLSSAINIVSKGALFLQNIGVAYYFGTTAETDVYYYGFATIMLITVFVNSLDASVIIPESMRLVAQEGVKKSMSFINFFIYLYLSIGMCATVVLFIDPLKVFTSISNFDPQVLYAHMSILNLLIPLFTLIIVTGLITNVLASHKFFTVPMLAGLINNTCTLLFILIFNEMLGIGSIIVGLYLSYIVNITFLLVLMKKQLKWKFSFEFLNIEKRVLKNIFYAQAGNSTSVLSSFAPIYFLSGFSPGIITALNIGKKTSEIPNQMITNQFSSVFGIKFNELIAEKKFGEINDSFNLLLNMLFFCLIPISSYIFLYSEELIVLLFHRGEFDMNSVRNVDAFLKYLIFLLPLLAVNTIVARLFMAGQKLKQAFWYQFLFNVALIVFVWVGINNFGIVGYPIALVSAHSLNVLIIYFLLQKHFQYINYRKVLLSFFRVIVLNVCISLPVIWINSFLIIENIFINLFFGLCYYLLALLGTNVFLNINDEVNKFFVLLRRKIKNSLNRRFT